MGPPPLADPGKFLRATTQGTSLHVKHRSKSGATQWDELRRGKMRFGALGRAGFDVHSGGEGKRKDVFPLIHLHNDPSLLSLVAEDMDRDFRKKP